MFYVYIIFSPKINKLYKGCSDNLKSRFDEHNNGKVKSTKLGRPWKLIHYQAFANKTDALREEKFLKTGKGRERINYLLKTTFKTWRGAPNG